MVKVRGWGCLVSSLKNIYTSVHVCIVIPIITSQSCLFKFIVAKYIVEQHDGTLTVCSTGIEGEGSNFTVRLPGLTVLPADDNMENGNPSADNDGRGALPQLSMLDLPTVDRPFISAAEYPDIQINDGDDDDPLSVTIPVNKVWNSLPTMTERKYYS